MKGKPANFIAFDIGSSKIAAIASNISKAGEVAIIGQILQYSSGFRAGTIVDLESAENSIIAAIYSLERECDKSINEITVSLSGSVKSYYVSHSVKLGNQAITNQDVKKLIQKAVADFSVKEQEIVYYVPVEFCVDKTSLVENPVGMYAKELSCQVHIIAANSLVLRNVTNCFAKCHIQVESFIPGIYASGLVCLSEDEKTTGSVIVDFGSRVTNIGVFFEGKIIYVGSIAIGGYHITIDIAKALSVSLSTAEKLKILYGDVRSDLLNKNQPIRISDFEPDNDYNHDLSISASRLAEIIRPRLKEILRLLKKDYDAIDVDHLLAKRVVITGGGAAMPGLKNLVAEAFQKQVRVAKPEILPGFTENFNAILYSEALGVIQSKALKYSKNSYKSAIYEDSGLVKKVFLWIKENI